MWVGMLEILVVLLAAKLAAEAAERLRVPVVVAEIAAGMIIGPYALGFVESTEVLRTLAELGAILLLLQVGMEVDLAELGAVGRASVTVASIGVIAPFAAGILVAKAFGFDNNVALFVGAALTATSVGITARVFSDLRALATVEARTVLGAAVADDVIGLIVLTVVVRLATGGSISASQIGVVLLLAFGFLVVASGVGVRFVPRAFAALARRSRSAGTLIAVALAFTLGLAQLAVLARLAPIIGAFVAGLSLGRSPAAGRIRRELAPVAHLFLPVFFLQIGIDADLNQFASVRVLLFGVAILAVGVIGKVISSLGLLRSPGDRWFVGLSMVPRGEVGLIFATIGLRANVFGADVYAALLLMVFASTLLTPPALKLRWSKMRPVQPAVEFEQEGALQVKGNGNHSTVDLVAPPSGQTLPRILDAALLVGDHRPGEALLEWISKLSPSTLRWDEETRAHFMRVLRHGNARSWRFLTMAGFFDRALPELADVLAVQEAGSAELDPVGSRTFRRLEQLKSIDELDRLLHPDRALVAALILDSTEGTNSDPLALTRRLVKRLEFDEQEAASIEALVADANLLLAASRRPDAFSEEAVLQLAVHLGSADQIDALLVLMLAGEEMEDWEKERAAAIRDLVHEVVSIPELASKSSAGLVESRRSEAIRIAESERARERIRTAPRAFVVAQTAQGLAELAALCERDLAYNEVRVRTRQLMAPNLWEIVFVSGDRLGLMAREAGVMADLGFSVLDAVAATWADGCALSLYKVKTLTTLPDVAEIRKALEKSLGEPLTSEPLEDVSIRFDDHASPWHTLGYIEVEDRPGLLHTVATAFAAAGVSVQGARVTTPEGRAVDAFELTDARGRKLDSRAKQRIVEALRTGTTPPSQRRIWGRATNTRRKKPLTTRS